MAGVSLATLALLSLATALVVLLTPPQVERLPQEVVVESLLEQVEPADHSMDYASLFTTPEPYERLGYPAGDGLIFIGLATQSALSSQGIDAINAAVAGIEAYGNSVGFVLYDLSTGMGLAYRSDEEFYSASSIKGLYAAAVVAADPNSFEADYPLWEALLVYSNNQAYETLVARYKMQPLRDWFVEADTSLEDSNPMYPSISARDLARLWLRNQEFFTSGAAHAEELAQLYTRPNHSAIHEQLGWAYTTYSKAGWFYPGAMEDEAQARAATEAAGATSAGDGQAATASAGGADGAVAADATSDAAGAADAQGEAAAAPASQPSAPVIYLSADPCSVDAGLVMAGERPYLLALTSDIPGALTRLTPLVAALDAAHDELAVYDLGSIVRIEQGIE
ncbi:MAG: hypothetical protein LBP28_04900 [Coriobacteriales bacterium]|nr:hypothetical protein [Coriobacteriales bacterium]